MYIYIYMSIDLNLKLHLASLAELGGVGTSSASPPKKNIYMYIWHTCSLQKTSMIAT